MNAGSVFEITEDMLFIGSSEYTKSTVYANFEKSQYDKADLYLTANEKGWLDLAVGETWNLNTFRNWLPLGNQVTNVSLALPDTHYQVVSVDGTPSDVVSVTPDANNNCYAEIKAEKPGTAIILVTYDAVYNNDGQGGKQYSAIWPENTGVIIVTVGAEAAGIATNMTVNEEANSTGKQVIDAEHDILFYVGDAGASYSFAPEAGCTVTVNRSTVGTAMTFGGFTNSGVEVASDGTVTVNDLTTGTHIIKVEKDGKAAYQVVRARQVTYEVLDSTGAAVNAENPAEPGEQVTIQFHGLVSPMEKMSGVYNANFGFWYNAEDGTEIRTSGGTYGVYNFSANSSLQKFSVSIPATWSNDTFTLTDGAIKIGGFGSSAGAHRTTTYIAGKEVNTNASGVAGVLSVLPDIAIPVNTDAASNIDESLRSNIFDSATDGTEWGRPGQAYVDALALIGAKVKNLSWEGDTCYVTLSSDTAMDADLGFELAYAAPDMPSWISNLSATFNGETLIAGEMKAGKLENGQFTAEVYAIYGTIAKYGSTKTFVLSVSDGSEEPDEPVAVESVTLDSSELELEVGQSATLSATVLPEDAADKAVSWESSDASVATADGSGAVTAVSAGSAIVTATAGGKSASCAVTVKAPAEPGPGPELSGSVDIATGDAAGSLQEIRATSIRVGAASEVVSNTAAADGKVTVQLAEDTSEIEITLSLAGKAGTALKKAAVSLDGADPTEPQSVDMSNNVALWSTKVTPEWVDGEATYTFTVGWRSSAGWKVPKDYVLTLKKAAAPGGGEEEDGAVDVHLSLSHDADYMTGNATDAVLALQKVSVPWFDLGLYGMEDYALESKEPTVLHHYIYTTELFYCGVSEEAAGKGYLKEEGLLGDVLQYEGAPGSIYFLKFWGQDANLNYYVNYEYPAVDGWGVTADQLVLKEGDVVTVGHFSSWSFYGDPVSGFNYLKVGDKTVSAAVQQGDEITLTTYLANGNLAGGESSGMVREQALDVYYAKADALTSEIVSSWDKFGTTDASGQLKATVNLAPGAYILAVPGQTGEYTSDIVSAPGAIRLTVAEGDVDEQLQNAIGLIDAIGEVTLESGSAIEAARAAYDALTDAQKALVSNLPVLEAAETAYSQLQTLEQDKAAAKAVDEKIDAIGEVTLESEAAIEAARAAYDGLTDAQKALVEKLAVLEAAEEALELLELAGADIAAIYEATGNYLAGLSDPSVGSTNGEWRVLGLARAGKTMPAGYYDAYYDAVVSYVEDNIDADGRLHAQKSTENARLIVALTAIGKDVTNVGGYDLLSGLDEMAYIGNQGLNGTIWTLIAFDAHDYDIPAGNATREKLVQAILDAQKSDGGWALSGTASDPDMTGMALQALAPYYGTNTAVKSAVDEALSWLSGIQTASGAFPASAAVTSETVSQVVTALTALGINPDTDARFVKNGISAVDALAAFYVDGGGFKHGLSGGINMMATEQGYYALASYFRLLDGKTSLYDMSDVEIEANQGDGPGMSEDEINEAAAKKVEDKIAAIGTVTKGSGSAIDAARKAYDKLTDAEKALVDNYAALTAAEAAYAKIKEQNSTVEVTFSLLGCYAHGEADGVHTLAAGNLVTWVGAKTYKVMPGSTVKDVLETALSQAGMSWSNPTGNYVESINGIGEFTNGSLSGWMYTLNGVHPGLGVAEQTVKAGDVIVFHYTDDYTKEQGGFSSDDTEAAKKVEDMIAALDGKSATFEKDVEAARAAYNALTPAQKKLVGNLADLEAAETELAKEKEQVDAEDAYKATGDYLEKLGTPGVGSVGGEWMVVGLARSGRDVPGVQDYLDAVVKYVQENADENGRLHQAKSTENARIALALTALGEDASSVLAGLNSMEYVQKQGINGPIWALIAFDSGNYPTPEGGDVTREALVAAILEAQLADGGWALGGDASDPDMTAMALQALAPYCDDADVKAAVDEALAALSAMQAADGSFASIDGKSAESVAQVVAALSALGIDADKDLRFVKKGSSALDALCSFFVDGGGFRHVADGNLDGMATEQGYYALAAYFRMLDGKTSLFDMTDVLDMGGKKVEEESEEAPALEEDPVIADEEGGTPWAPVAGVAGAAAIAAAVAAFLKLRRPAA